MRRHGPARSSLREAGFPAIGGVAIVAIALSAVSGVAARELPRIDRLADQPALTAAPAAIAGPVADAALHRHSRLGVPTFVWPQRSSAAADLVAARVEALPDDPVAAARAWLRHLGPLYALPAATADAVPALFAQGFPNGGALVKFRNRIAGVEVFREEAAVLLGPDRNLLAIGGFLTGGGDGAPAAAAAIWAQGPHPASMAALADWSFDPAAATLFATVDTRDEYMYFDLPSGTLSADGSRLDLPVRAKPVWFRLPHELVSAWYIEVQVRDGAKPGAIDNYAYVVSAADNAVLFRHNQTAEAAFAYRVFAESAGNNSPLPSPQGRNGYPHPTATPDGYQGPFVTPNLITLQNLPFSRNDPWLTAGATQTTGNNVDAFADLAAPDGFSAGDLRASTTSAGAFDRSYDTALAPDAGIAQRMAAVTNLFYMNNWLHDWFYDAGFDEVAGNAQTDNYGRGGLAADSMVAEAQDYAGRNNASMTTVADGGRPRMRMFVFDAVQGVQTSVNTPAAIAGPKPDAGATFGPRTFNITGNLVTATPADGCAALSGLTGSIALIDRGGTCSYKAKVINAQNAGATGVIIANSTAGAFTMTDDPAVPATSVIPAVMIALADGIAIKARLPAPGVNVHLVSVIGPNRDGTLDNTIIAHEWGHYISGRLVGNASGLTTTQSQGMGEGWGDFHSLLLLVKAADATLPSNANWGGAYALGGYALGSLPGSLGNDSHYWGFRRYPYSRDLTRNPLTFKHIADGIALPLSPIPKSGADGSANSEVHNTGEVWSSMLWECYSNLLNDAARLSFDQAQDRMKRYLVTGYKMTPHAPTFTEARDALLAAMAAQDSKDYALCYQGFAKRGAGFGAVAPDRFATSNAGVVESYAAGGALSVLTVTLSDAPGSCDANGMLVNGETGTLSAQLKNTGTAALAATTGSVSAGNPHVSFPNGASLTIAPMQPGQSQTVTLPVHVAGAAGIEAAAITVTVDDPALDIPRPVTVPASFWINARQQANQSATDTVEAAGTAWTTGSSNANPTADMLWQRIAVSGSDHRWLGPDVATSQLNWLQSPPLQVAAAGSFSFTFRHRHSFDGNAGTAFDGGQIQISTNGGANWTDIGAAASPGYNGTMGAYTGNPNPLAGLSGYVRTNPTYPALQTVSVSLGAAYAGQTVRVRFAIGSDIVSPAGGWEIDDIAFANITNTPFDALVADPGTCLSIAAVAGRPQWALVGTAFGAALTARVSDSTGAPAPGVAVTFASPGAGASATFGGPATVSSDGSGIATSPVLTANGIAGPFDASAGVGAHTATFGLVNVLVPPHLDIDANSHYDALTDGLLALRYLSGLSGDALKIGVLGVGATRTESADIVQFIDNIRPLLDIDANGQADAYTDGLLLVRYLFGLRGAALIAGAVGPGAARDTAALVEGYIQSLLP